MTREEEEDNEPTDQMIAVNEDPSTMEDRYHMTHIMFYFLGVASVIPAHFFTTATDYWMYKFRDPMSENYTSNNRTGLQAEFISDYSIVSNVSNVFFLVVTIFFLRKKSMPKRMITALCGVIVMFVFTCMFIQVNTDSWQRGFFVTTLIIGFLLTGFCSVFMVTLFQMVARFPSEYLAAILSGHSICGIFAALVQIFSLSIGASSKITGLTYFAIGMFFIFLTLVGFLATLYKSPFFNYHLTKELQTAKPQITKELLLSILNKLKFYLASMVIVLGCTIMLHPGVLSLIVSVDKGNGHKWNDVYFVPVTTFLIYFTCDYIGRELACYINRPQNSVIIFIISILRIALVPMLMLCDIQPRSHLPVVFNEDYAYIILIILLALSNGYLGNLCVIQVPFATKEEEKPIALILIVVIMIASLGACSFISKALIESL